MKTRNKKQNISALNTKSSIDDNVTDDVVDQLEKDAKELTRDDIEGQLDNDRTAEQID